MYNYFAYSKQQSKQKDKKRSEEKEKQHEQSNKKKKLKYIENYMDKAKRKILNKNNETTIGTYSNKKYQPRPTHKQFNIGFNGLHYHASSGKVRAEQSASKNQILDSVPFTLDMNHNYRDFKNEKPMVYTTSNSSMRVFQNVKNMRTNEVPSKWNSSHKNKLVISQSRSPSATKNKVSKCILPQLNSKRYPNSYTSLKNETPFGPLSNIENMGLMPSYKSNSVLQDQQVKLSENRKPLKIKERKLKFSTVHVHTSKIQN